MPQYCYLEHVRTLEFCPWPCMPKLLFVNIQSLRRVRNLADAHVVGQVFESGAPSAGERQFHEDNQRPSNHGVSSNYSLRRRSDKATLRSNARCCGNQGFRLSGAWQVCMQPTGNNAPVDPEAVVFGRPAADVHGPDHLHKLQVGVAALCSLSGRR